MLSTHTERLTAAKQRLTAALAAGEDTAPHRAAVQQVERDIQRIGADHRQAAQAQAQRIAEATTRRSREIVSESRQRIAASLPKAPTSPRSIKP